MNTRIICALFKKDLKGCLSNKNILVSFLIPIVFCFIYQYMFSGLGDDVNTYVLSMCAVFSISIIPSSILPVMIAEEKEKYTLRSLMLARVQGQERDRCKAGCNCSNHLFPDALQSCCRRQGYFLLANVLPLCACVRFGLSGDTSCLISFTAVRESTADMKNLLFKPRF